MPQINEAYAYCETCNIYFYYTKDGCPLCKKSEDMSISKVKNLNATKLITKLKKKIKDLEVNKPAPKPKRGKAKK